MLQLALDTSTRQASIALCTEEMLLGEYTWQVGNNHSVELLERIQRLVTECGQTMHSLEAISVAIGPGSFNGLRVALATAKSLAFALSIPLVGISTLDVIATQQQQWSGPICAVMEAGRGELYAACYQFRDMIEDIVETGILSYEMQRFNDYMLASSEQLIEYVLEHVSSWVGVPGERSLPSVLFCGELSEALRNAISAQQPDGMFFAALPSPRYALTLATRAFSRFQRGIVDDPLLLEPLYLRRPSITTSARKQPLLGGGGKTHRSGDVAQTEREEGALHN